MKILLIAEHDNQKITSATSHVLAAAKELGDTIDMLVMGYACDAVTNAAQRFAVRQVLCADAKAYQHHLAENEAPLVAMLAEDYDVILVGATTYGKNLLPRVAALLDVAMVGDVIKIVSPDTFQRPIYAGNAIATVQSTDSIKLLTIRPTSFPAVIQESTPLATLKKIDALMTPALASFVSQSLSVSNRPELTNARIIVSGGRGLKNAENFKLLEQLADRLGAAIGASRAAVDAGFAPNDYQVGQTGKVVAPELYIAVGISGAIQHVAGIKDSKIIIAINNDPEAPIFQVADYGLVADLFTALSELQSALG